ncbi:hypothetical protein [Hoylesella saccharolytica]|uniref:hypothetical protein n=1 Tax=Hoylesella saccharolytica TaxID=633701 RepID=UPI0028D61D66|nr:hypothetical protein [Hoylesella saccharolytica]
MKKQTYVCPTIKVLPLTLEGFICLSIPIGPGPGPGGGGQAKGGFFEEEDEEDADEQSFAGYSPWED